MEELVTGSSSMTTPTPSTRCAATGPSTRSSSNAGPVNPDARRPAAGGRPGSVAALGLDLGTSSAKAVVIDTGGRVLAQASAGYAVTSARAGYAESEPADWWKAVTACAREAVDAGGARPAAVGLSGQMHGLVMAGRDGGALRPALLWADSRATGALRAYRRLSPRALARLANPLVPGMTGPMLKWIAENEPRTYRDTSWALAPKDWIRARLTGEFYAEPSDASATLLYDLMRDGWDLEVVAALGLDASLLAPLLPSAGAPAGRLTAEAAAELGLSAGLPVAAGAGDTAAAALGSGMAGPGDIQLTVGTGAQVIRPLAAPVSRAEAGVNLYRAATPDGWYHMGATISAGLSLNWVCGIMNATWEELYASADQPGQAHDPIFVPHLSGERTPYCDPALRGSWTGLALADDRASVLRSALEGTAFAIRDALDALLGDDRPPRLRLAGGGTLATGWRQLLGDVLGVPLYAVDVPAASGRGAALLGATAAGLLSFDDIAGPLAPAARLAAEPDPAAAAFHAERHARFRRIVSALKVSALEVTQPSDAEVRTMTA
jgi:xylulokinase